MNLMELYEQKSHDEVWYVSQNGYPVTNLMSKISARKVMLEWSTVLSGLDVRQVW